MKKGIARKGFCHYVQSLLATPNYFLKLSLSTSSALNSVRTGVASGPFSVSSMTMLTAALQRLVSLLSRLVMVGVAHWARMELLQPMTGMFLWLCRAAR